LYSEVRQGESEEWEKEGGNLRLLGVEVNVLLAILLFVVLAFRGSFSLLPASYYLWFAFYCMLYSRKIRTSGIDGENSILVISW
jgi:hypothetical protein